MNDLTIICKPNEIAEWPDFQVSYSSMHAIKRPGFKENLYSFNDVSIKAKKSPSDEKLVIVENAFMIDLFYSTPYFHRVIDIFGEFESIKKIIPDLKIVMLYSNRQSSMNVFKKQYEAPGFAKAYGLSVDDVVFLEDYSEVVFKNTYVLNPNFKTMISLLAKNRQSFYTNGELKQHLADIIPELRKTFLLDPSSGVDKKIFISRMQENTRLRNIKDILVRVKLGQPVTIDERVECKKLGYFACNEIMERTPSKEDEENIERYFKDNGYEIVNPGNLDIFEQATLYNQSSSVAGIAGTGILNTIFCNPGTKVIILNTSDSYLFMHEDVSEASGNIVYSIPAVKEGGGRQFSSKDILDEVINLGLV